MFFYLLKDRYFFLWHQGHWSGSIGSEQSFISQNLVYSVYHFI